MALLGNMIWFVLFGWWSFLLYAFLGVLCYITIIGIPIGKALFQYAKLMAFPYGKVIIKETELKGVENVSAIRRVGGTIANIIWLPIGVVTFILNIVTMIASAITIIGIPFAVVVAKSCMFLLWPIGAKVITKEQAETLRMERSMMKVAGTAMAVNNMAYGQPPQPQAIEQQMSQPQAIPMNQAAQSQNQTAQSSMALDNLKAGGAQALEGIRETGGQAMSAIIGTGSAGASVLKKKQMRMKEQALARQRDVTMDELLIQIESKLYRNKVMEWIMPFLEYITLAVGIICAIIGMIHFRWMLIGGFFYGIIMAAPLMIMAAVLGMIKKNHVFVLIVLGTQLVAYIALGIMGRGFSILWILCYIGIIAGYVCLFMINKSAGQQQTVSASGMQETPAGAVFRAREDVLVTAAEAAPIVKRFCSQCGADVSGGIAFCGKCGAKVDAN